MHTAAVTATRPVVRWTPPVTRALLAITAITAPTAPAATPTSRLSTSESAITSRRRPAACPQQREVATIALDRPQRGQVGQSERDQRARNGEHDVERLGVERVAGRGGELVVRLSTNCTWPGSDAFDPVAGAVGQRERVGGTAGQRRGIQLSVHLPLHAVLRAGDRAGPGARGRDRAQAGRVFVANVSSGITAMFAGGWAGAGPTCGFSGANRTPGR